MIKITKHSYNRIQERIGFTSFEKIKKLANKAFESTEKLPKWFTDLELYLTKFGYITYKYTFYKSFIWVFQNYVYKEKNKFILITVYKSNYKKNNIKKI